MRCRSRRPSKEPPGKERKMVSFELTDEQREIRDWVHAFAEKEIRPVAAQYDESEEFPWPVVKKAADLGLYGRALLPANSRAPTGHTPAPLLRGAHLCPPWVGA